MKNLLKSKKFKIIISIFYIIFAMEFFLRIFAPIPMLPRYIKATEFGIRGNMGNESYWHKTPDYKVLIKTNSKGIRTNEEFTYEKPAGVKRIVVLGDSFGMGYGVNLEDTFLSQMETNLEKDGSKVQVINLSVSGHGNSEQLIMLKNEGFKYNPDLVLLCWHRTDLLDNVRSNMFALKNGKLEQTSSVYLPGVKVREMLFKYSFYRWLAGNSHLYNWLRDKAGKTTKNIMSALSSKKGENVITDENPEATYKYKLTLSLLQKIRHECDQRKINFMIFDIPEREGRKKYWSVLPIDKKRPFHAISPKAIFNTMTGKLLYWERSHGHFTPMANKINGRLIADYIETKKLLLKYKK